MFSSARSCVSVWISCVQQTNWYRISLWVGWLLLLLLHHVCWILHTFVFVKFNPVDAGSGSTSSTKRAKLNSSISHNFVCEFNYNENVIHCIVMCNWHAIQSTLASPKCDGQHGCGSAHHVQCNMMYDVVWLHIKKHIKHLCFIKFIEFTSPVAIGSLARTRDINVCKKPTKQTAT